MSHFNNPQNEEYGNINYLLTALGLILSIRTLACAHSKGKKELRQGLTYTDQLTTQQNNLVSDSDYTNKL